MNGTGRAEVRKGAPGIPTWAVACLGILAATSPAEAPPALPPPYCLPERLARRVLKAGNAADRLDAYARIAQRQARYLQIEARRYRIFSEMQPPISQLVGIEECAARGLEGGLSGLPVVPTASRARLERVYRTASKAERRLASAQEAARAHPDLDGLLDPSLSMIRDITTKLRRILNIPP